MVLNDMNALNNSRVLPLCRIYQRTSSRSVPDNSSLVYSSASEANSTTGVTNLSRTNVKHEIVYDHEATFEWFEIAIPTICAFGIVGNVMNIAILTRRRHLAGLDKLGRTANYGLTALALSDLLFCFIVLPHAFVTSFKYTSDTSRLFIMMYKLYGVASINLFIMISTWLIVTMAIKRYCVVVHPLHARDYITSRRTCQMIVIVYVISIILTMPHYLHMKVGQCLSPEGAVEMEYQSRWPDGLSSRFRQYIRWVWPLFADFIPILILVICNIRLVVELKSASIKRKSNCPGQSIKKGGQRVTLILVIIVLMLLVLVSPSEVLRYIDPYKSWGKTGYIIASVTNMLQTVNFAFNFLLYFGLSSKFRSTALSLIKGSCSSNDETRAHYHFGARMTSKPVIRSGVKFHFARKTWMPPDEEIK